MKLIVGLGNPGKEYEKTRHNVGFMVVERLAKELQTEFNQMKFKGMVAEGQVGGKKVFLLKPMTYMNLSGESIIQAVNFYKLTPDELLVIYDDMDTPVGQIRLRMKGSSGGHNGIKSIIRHLGTEQFKRIRVGIGRPDPGREVVDYVLEKFRPEELNRMEEAVSKSSEAAKLSITESFDKVMNKYN